MINVEYSSAVQSVNKIIDVSFQISYKSYLKLANISEASY